jgi:urease accessory protein
VTTRLESMEGPTRVYSRSRLVFDAARGRTRLVVSDLGAPLRVMRGFDLEDGRLLVQVISAAPGFFSGDRYELAIEVGPGARALVITPAASKIHSMPDGGAASQILGATVAAGGSLEIYPTLSIPFAFSDFRQNVEISLEDGARFGWMDPWSFGRIESGERYAFRRISSRLRIDRAGRPLYRDAMELAPAETDAGAMGALEQATHAANGCWFGQCIPWEPTGELTDETVFGRVGADGLYVRGLFAEGRTFRRGLENVRRKIAAAWSVSEISQTRFTL